MSHAWVLDSDNRWQAHRLDATGCDLHALLLPPGSGVPTDCLADGRAARILSFRIGEAERWVLVAGPDAPLRVNGVPLGAVGARVLGNRDEIAIPGFGSAYFSTESLAEVVAFPGADHMVLCARCRQEIVRGSPSVKCPGCSAAYHETPELPCFTYHSHCALCPAATALDAGFSWVPEE